HDCRYFAVWINRSEIRRVLLTLARIDRDQLIRQSGFLEKQRDLHRIRREVEVETDQKNLLGRCDAANAGACCGVGWRRKGPYHGGPSGVSCGWQSRPELRPAAPDS